MVLIALSGSKHAYARGGSRKNVCYASEVRQKTGQTAGGRLCVYVLCFTSSPEVRRSPSVELHYPNLLYFEEIIGRINMCEWPVLKELVYRRQSLLKGKKERGKFKLELCGFGDLSA